MKANLICGDIHAKPQIIQAIIRIQDDYDKIIFLGDYVDDWNTPPNMSYATITDLVNLKKTHPDKYILLLGNHCLSSWLAGKFRCSGFDPMTNLICSPVYEENISLFNLAYYDGNFLYTHAGITESFRKNTFPDEHSGEKIAELLNHTLWNKDTDEDANRIFNLLNSAGPARGGSGIPSPLWADDSELMNDPADIDCGQIVGHTPQLNIKEITKDSHTLYFCDTHSTYSNGEPYGNNNLLVVKGKQAESIPLPKGD